QNLGHRTSSARMRSCPLPVYIQYTSPIPYWSILRLARQRIKGLPVSEVNMAATLPGVAARHLCRSC
ncbi:MAG: hypothetical protein ABLT11_09225, partial [Candidatus Acidiferrum sp.]